MLFAHGSMAAHDFAKKWLQSITKKPISQFVDLHHLQVEGKVGMHSVATIRDLIEKASLSPFVAAGKAFIIEDAERMLPASANALLKTIEEPPPNTLFILVSQAPEKILPTIRSRSQLVRFKPLKKTREPLIKALPKSTEEIVAFAENMQQHFDDLREDLEKELMKRAEKETKEMNATQRHLVEIRQEGEISSRFFEEVDAMLRDIALLFQGRADEKVSRALSAAKLAIQRSMPVKHALESLFFRLHKGTKAT